MPPNDNPREAFLSIMRSEGFDLSEPELEALSAAYEKLLSVSERLRRADRPDNAAMALSLSLPRKGEA